MNRREFIALTVVAILAGRSHATRFSGEVPCRGCGRPIWRGTRAYLLARLGRDEQDEYCLRCLSTIETEEERRTLFAPFQRNETA
jgi:hypothetical protein